MLAEDAEQALEWGERALELAIRLGDESTRAHALVNIGSAKVAARSPGDRDAARGARDRRRRRRPARGDARARQPRLRADAAGCGRSAALRYAEQALAYAEEHEVHTLASYVATMIAWLRLRAGRVGRGRAGRAGRDRAGQHRRRSCSPRRSWPSWPFAGAIRMPPSGWPTSRRRPIARASCSGSRRSSSWRPSGR